VEYQERNQGKVILIQKSPFVRTIMHRGRGEGAKDKKGPFQKRAFSPKKPPFQLRILFFLVSLVL